MKRITIGLLLTVTLVTACFAASTLSKLSYKPKEGFVPNEQTAIAIAVAVWTPIYGEKMLSYERPFVATLKDNVWQVEGTLPQGALGGVAIAEIAKDDGRILAVIHGK